MGHLTNQIGFRLSSTRFWNLTCNLFYLKDMSQLLKLNEKYKRYVQHYFSNSALGKYRKGLYFSHFKIVIIQKVVFVLVFFYDQDRETIYARKFIFDRLYRRITKIKFFSYRTRRGNLGVCYYLFKKILLKLRANFFDSRFNLVLRIYKNLVTVVFNKVTAVILDGTTVQLKFFRTVASVFEASYVAHYIILNLRNNRSFFSVTRHVARDLLIKNKNILGYKLSCNGRFSKKQRATHHWKSAGKLAFSSLNSNVDYAQSVFHDKNGKYSIKVWLNFQNTARPTFLI